MSSAKRVFAVIRERGDDYQLWLPLEEQLDWEAHAAYMDELHAEGFFIFAGPLEGTGEVLLIVRAGDEGEILQRLDEDPWTGTLLNTVRIAEWNVRVGSLP
jgi:uncharacterized protein YciI